MMTYSVLAACLDHLSGVQTVWYIFVFLLISTTARICVYVLNYMLWRRKFSKTIPAIKTRFFNLLGNVSELPLTKRARNGQSILVHSQQLLLGHAKLLVQEKLYCLWVFFHPVIVLSTAEAVEAVYSGTKAVDKPLFYRWMRIFFGNGLVLSDSDKWKVQRKLLNPCFRSDILKEHLLIMNEQSQILVKLLRKETEKDFTKIFKYLSDCTFDIICGTIYGIDMGSQKSNKETESFVYAVNKGFKRLVARVLNIFIWPDVLFHASKTGKEIMRHSQVARDFTRDLIEKERQKFLKNSEPSEKQGKSLLKQLLKYYYLSKEMNEEDITDQLITFMVAGHDTAKITASWTLYMLGLHADMLAKVHDELDSIFGDDQERYATVEDLNNMKYLDCAIKETLRLYPPVPILGRCLSEDTTICGYQIPKGATCVMFPHVLHRDVNVFPNPEKFDPDRFLPENSASRHPYAWVPFGAGPRNCIGKQMGLMELLTITSTILRRYTVESLDHRDKVLPTLTIALASSIPLKIRLRLRHSKETQ